MSAEKNTGLTLVGAVGKKTDYKLRSALVAIGSDPTNEIFIDEPTVSRRHAEVMKRSGFFSDP